MTPRNLLKTFGDGSVARGYFDESWRTTSRTRTVNWRNHTFCQHDHKLLTLEQCVRDLIDERSNRTRDHELDENVEPRIGCRTERIEKRIRHVTPLERIRKVQRILIGVSVLYGACSCWVSESCSRLCTTNDYVLMAKGPTLFFPSPVSKLVVVPRSLPA